MAYQWDFATVFLPPGFWIQGALITLACASVTTVAGCVVGLVLGPALLSRSRLVRLVILPQAARRMVPPLVSQSVLQMKNTALLSVVAIPELMYRSSVMVSETFRPLEVYTGLAAMYFVLLFPMVMLSKRLELKAQS